MKQSNNRVPAALLLLTMSSASWAEEWIQPHEPLLFSVATHEEGESFNQMNWRESLRFFLNRRDVTSLIERGVEDQFIYPADKLPLPVGDVELKIYEITSEGWHELHVKALKVLNHYGFKKANTSASYSLTLDAQLDAGAKGEAIDPEERQTQDVSGQINLATEHAKRDVSVTTRFNVLGFSKAENTLQFAEKQSAAPKVDLSEYIATVASTDMSLSIGHVNFGNHPLLISSLSNRGVNAAYRVSDRFDLSLTAQNGSHVVGWENLVGLDNTDHQIMASTLGVELALANPGSHRLEITLLNGNTQSIDDFGVGEVTDAESNRGWGIYYQSILFDERLTIGSALAKSEYRNTADEQLFQEENVVATKATKDTAWYVELGSVLIQENVDNPLMNYATRLSYRKEYADPFYRAIAASVSADTVTESYAIEGSFQYATWGYTWSDSEDNVDDINNILKTGTRHETLSLGLNPNDWLQSLDYDSSLTWWPTVSLSLQRIEQQALNNPEAEESDFNGGSHLPNQINKIADLSFEWELPQGRVGYLYAWSEQDNRQEGRELADFKRVSHGVSFSKTFIESIDLAVSVGRAVNQDVELETDFINRHGSVNVTWQLPSNYVLELGYSINQDYTNLGLSESDSSTSNIGISHQWQSIDERDPMTIQWFVRYALQRNDSKDLSFGISSFSESWVTNAGLTMSF